VLPEIGDFVRNKGFSDLPDSTSTIGSRASDAGTAYTIATGPSGPAIAGTAARAAKPGDNLNLGEAAAGIKAGRRARISAGHHALWTDAGIAARIGPGWRTAFHSGPLADNAGVAARNGARRTKTGCACTVEPCRCLAAERPNASSAIAHETCRADAGIATAVRHHW